jgi:hypothetical protein
VSPSILAELLAVAIPFAFPEIYYRSMNRANAADTNYLFDAKALVKG